MGVCFPPYKHLMHFDPNATIPLRVIFYLFYTGGILVDYLSGAIL
jgi:hypothetical protein